MGTGSGMAAVSISGFVMNVILPSRHAIRHAGARAHASQLLGMGRHDWGTIHTWVGVALLLLLILHVAFHWKTIDAFFHKNLPNRGVRTAVVGLLTLFALMAILPWIYAL